MDSCERVLTNLAGSDPRRRVPAGVLAFVFAVLGGSPGSGPASAVADVFVLNGGGRIREARAESESGAAGEYVIETRQGIRVRLPAAQVQRVIAADPRHAAYRERGSACDDSIAGHWELAEWCRQQRLDGPRAQHLRRILALDPDHAGARYGLGYSQVRGQWVLQDGLQHRRGYRRYAGRWRTEQEIALHRRAQQQTSAERNWLTQLRRWRQRLNTEDAATSWRRIADVRDPAAVPGLAELLADEPFRHVRLLYVETLAAIGTADAIEVLFQTGLGDLDEEIFHACLDALVRLAPPQLAARYVEHLDDASNLRVNRAAYALGRLDDRSVLSPLIDALVTTHMVVVPAGPRGYHATFVNPLSGPGIPAGFPAWTPAGGTGISAGNEQTILSWTVPNQEVLQALIELSHGANFGFDQQAWRFWLASESRRNPPQVRGRRD